MKVDSDYLPGGAVHYLFFQIMRAERQRWRRRLGAQPRQGPRAGAAFFSTRRWPRSKGAASHFVVVIEESKIVPASVALVPIRSRSARLGRQSRVQRHVRATLWPEPWLCALQVEVKKNWTSTSLWWRDSMKIMQAMKNPSEYHSSGAVVTYCWNLMTNFGRARIMHAVWAKSKCSFHELARFFIEKA